MVGRPTGTVTFLFTDVEDASGSRLLTQRTGDYLGIDRAMATVRKEAARRGWSNA